MRWWTGSTLFRFWLVAWSDQCWNIVNWTLDNKFQWNMNKIHNFLFVKLHLSSGKLRPFCPGGGGGGGGGGGMSSLKQWELVFDREVQIKGFVGISFNICRCQQYFVYIFIVYVCHVMTILNRSSFLDWQKLRFRHANCTYAVWVCLVFKK